MLLSVLLSVLLVLCCKQYCCCWQCCYCQCCFCCCCYGGAVGIAVVVGNVVVVSVVGFVIVVFNSFINAGREKSHCKLCYPIKHLYSNSFDVTI